MAKGTEAPSFPLSSYSERHTAPHLCLHCPRHSGCIAPDFGFWTGSLWSKCTRPKITLRRAFVAEQLFGIDADTDANGTNEGTRICLEERVKF